ncbi:MAG TPA: endopeptidase La, partial [Flexistipes sinusarabici]|nr:endopeptidase La [Flexistipes sinusarabici]
DMVVFPYMVLPLYVGRDASIAAVDEALSGERMIFLSSQKNAEIEEPDVQDIYNIGTVALILRMLKLPDGRVKILVQGLKRAEIDKYEQEDPFYKVKLNLIEESEPEEGLKSEALVRHVKEQLSKAVNL